MLGKDSGCSNSSQGTLDDCCNNKLMPVINDPDKRQAVSICVNRVYPQWPSKNTDMILDSLANKQCSPNGPKVCIFCIPHGSAPPPGVPASCIAPEGICRSGSGVTFLPSTFDPGAIQPNSKGDTPEEAFCLFYGRNSTCASDFESKNPGCDAGLAVCRPDIGPLPAVFDVNNSRMVSICALLSHELVHTAHLLGSPVHNRLQGVRGDIVHLIACCLCKQWSQTAPIPKGLDYCADQCRFSFYQGAD